MSSIPWLNDDIETIRSAIGAKEGDQTVYAVMCLRDDLKHIAEHVMAYIELAEMPHAGRLPGYEGRLATLAMYVRKALGVVWSREHGGPAMADEPSASRRVDAEVRLALKADATESASDAAHRVASDLRQLRKGVAEYIKDEAMSGVPERQKAVRRLRAVLDGIETPE